MKTLLKIVVIVVAAFAIYFFFSPRLAISNIEAAIEEQDQEKLEASIDFPALRQNLKDQINARITDKIGTPRMQQDPFAALTEVMARGIVDQMADAYITPAGFLSAMRGDSPIQDKTAGEKDSQDVPDRSKPFAKARYTYDSLSQFSAWVPGSQGREARFVLTRQGLAWRLTNIVLPWGASGSQAYR